MRFLRSGSERDKEKKDDEIIALFKQTRDSFYIGILFDRYSHLVFAVSMKYLKNEEDSKDSVLRIFEKLSSDLITYEIQYFSSWLHTVTRNHCLKFIEQNKHYNVPPDNLPNQIDDDEESFQKTYLPHLEEAISKLNTEQRTCIELFYLQKMSYEEVSAMTGFTMLQVKSYIQNGKRNLKIILLKKLDDK
jgi:RNA polymerase sigma factor (sigma-70 family)